MEGLGLIIALSISIFISVIASISKEKKKKEADRIKELEQRAEQQRAEQQRAARQNVAQQSSTQSSPSRSDSPRTQGPDPWELILQNSKSKKKDILPFIFSNSSKKQENELPEEGVRTINKDSAKENEVKSEANISKKTKRIQDLSEKQKMIVYSEIMNKKYC